MSPLLTLLDKMPDPYSWIYGVSTVAFLILAWRVKGRRAIFFSLAFLAAGLGVLETYFRQLDLRESIFQTQYKGPEHIKLEDEVGYSAIPNARARAVEFDKQGHKIYDVRYTIDSEGNRITSAREISNPKRCLVFFGCSFIFGDGLEDNESLPYLLSDRIGDDTKAFNFAFHGYGPHNSLAQIESGRVEASLAACKGRPIHAFLGTAAFHVARATGQQGWTRKGPKYVLRKGKLSREGTFDAYGNHLLGFRLNEKVLYGLEKSHLFSHLLNPTRAVDTTIYVAVVAEMVRKFQTIFPGAKFDILYWTGPWESEREKDKRILPDLAALPVRVFTSKEMIPDLFGKRERFFLPDAHPSAQANQRISTFLRNYLRKNL